MKLGSESILILMFLFSPDLKYKNWTQQLSINLIADYTLP